MVVLNVISMVEVRNQYGGGARVKRTGFPEQFAKELVKQSGEKLLMPQEEKKD